jgi:hypothetical protein
MHGVYPSDYCLQRRALVSSLSLYISLSPVHQPTFICIWYDSLLDRPFQAYHHMHACMHMCPAPYMYTRIVVVVVVERVNLGKLAYY